MENVNFQPSGEEIERALMDLGPLLGVTIKEEVQDELGEASSAPASRVNVGSASESGKGSGGGDGGGGADSLASPGAARSPAGARCVLCQAPLALADGTPKLMECLHSACEPCINAKLEERQANSRDFLGAERITVTCPACRLQCQVANMIDQRFVLEKMAADQAGSSSAGVGEQQCNSCEDTEPATSYCVDCAEFICDNCVHAHQRLKITKDHTIKSKEEALAELQAAQATPSANDMFCRDHVQERLTLFCETCDRLTCRDCQLQHHRDHKYQFSTEMAAQARANISSLLSEVSYKRVLLGSAMKVIRDRQQLIADKKKALVHDITQTVVKLTNAINTRGKQLVLRLNEVCDAKQRTLAEKKDALEQLAAITDHCVDFVTRALDQGSDTAVLYSKRAVCSHLQRIKSRRADIPNPEIPVRISLALDKLPDLIRVLSSIGAIVVDGKVDGAGGAQGPYHPPAQPPPAPPAHPAPPAPPAPPHSAVVALQQVAMHQSYVQSVPGGGGYLLQTRHARPPTPLRHPHVTSTTHPHHLHGMNEMNLRGLLSAQAQRGAAPARAPLPSAHPAAHPSAHAAMQHAYQQSDDGRVRIERVQRGERGERAARARARARAARGLRPAQRRPAHALARAQLPAPARQVAHPAAERAQRRRRRGRAGRRRVRRARVQDHAGPAARARRARRRHLHQPQDAQPQSQRRGRRAGAGQGVRGVGAGPHGHHRQAGLQRRAGGGRAARARAARRLRALARAARALQHRRRRLRESRSREPGGGRRRGGRGRPQRGLVRRVHGRRRAHVLRQVPQGLPPVLPHPHHREAARRDGELAVPAVRELRGLGRGGRGLVRAGAVAAPAAPGGAHHAGAVLPVRGLAALPRARARRQPALPLQDRAADVPGRHPHAAAAARAAALHARGAVRARLPPAVPQRLPLQPAGLGALQGRQAAGGVLRRAAGQVPARVRLLERRRRAPAEARARPRAGLLIRARGPAAAARRVRVHRPRRRLLPETRPPREKPRPEKT